MSPIKLYHMSITHTQTPIIGSHPKAFLCTKTSTLQAASKKIQKYRSSAGIKPKAFRNFKNFNLKYEEHSKQNHSNYLPKSQSSLELSSKASKNFKQPQISETVWIQASKAPKNFPHKPSKMKNTQRT